MFSNVGFYATQGYFDISSMEKPLLHPWTLSVEEQFYFVVSILLVLIIRLGNNRFGQLAAAIGFAVAALSLTGTIFQTSMNGRNAAFYLSLIPLKAILNGSPPRSEELNLTPPAFFAWRALRQISEQLHLAPPARHRVEHQPDGDG